MEARELTSDGRLLTAMFIAFVSVAVLAAVDLGLDLRAGTTVRHVLAEGALFAVGLVGAVVVARRFRDVSLDARHARQQVRELATRLEETRKEAERWRNEARDALDELGAAIDREFERWQLTAAEKEVALLLLKGLSHKEIAEVRSITEATARQQARAVYRKGGLSGRHDLSAFFLEDLLLPRTDRSD